MLRVLSRCLLVFAKVVSLSEGQSLQWTSQNAFVWKAEDADRADTSHLVVSDRSAESWDTSD